MKSDLDLIRLHGRQSIRITEPAAVAIRCVSGCLWVTQTGDPQDYILMPGDSVEFAKKGLVITSALQSSLCQLSYRLHDIVEGTAHGIAQPA